MAQQNIAPGAIASRADITEDSAAHIHAPVLLDECVELVAPALHEGAIAVDCTLGLGGHSLAFLQANPTFRLIGIDRDAEALQLASNRLAQYSNRFTPVHDSFNHFGAVLDSLNLARVDVVFLDLGLSSLQIDEKDRGFAYSVDEPLDMRMDTSQSLTAEEILATYSRDDLARIFRDYGQERWAWKIAAAIDEARAQAPLRTTGQLTALVDRVVPRKNRPAGNPAKRVFQALRIETNGELDELASVLPQIALRLNARGRIVVEAYHSLEDTIVKRFFAAGLHANVPHGLPQIPEDQLPYFADLTHGAIKADRAEAERNSRSTSVRLRAVELTRELPEPVRQRMQAEAADPHAFAASQHGRFQRKGGRR